MLNSIASRLYLLLIIAAGLASCESTTETTPDNSTFKKPSLVVLNEGRFMGTNASLDVVDLSTGTRKANVLPNLGDVGSDVELINGKIYILTSNSRKLYVVDPADGAIKSTLNFSAESSPNAIAAISGTEALVTHLFQPRIDIIDLTKNTIKDSIMMSQGTVDIVTLNGYAYVTGSMNWAYMIDANTKQIVDSVQVGNTPQRIVADAANNQVVTIAWGQYQPAGPGAITTINSSTFDVTRSIEVPVGSAVNRTIMGNGKLYLLYADRTMTMDLVTGTFAPATFINAPFLGGVYDKTANELYLGKGDYTSAGEVEVYDATLGTLKRSYPAGIAPSHFALYR